MNQMIKDNEEAIGWKNLKKNEEKDNKLNSSRDTLTNTLSITGKIRNC